jgi:hypothetical protein
MSTQANPIISDAPVPPPIKPDGIPATVTDPISRNVLAEKEQEMRADKAAADKKQGRFLPRKIITEKITPRSDAPDFETLLYKTAANFPFRELSYLRTSTFVPNTQAFYIVLAAMDSLMANTKRWTDNCMGWAPPLSQAYYGILIYIQVMRAMSSVSLLSSDLEMVLTAFYRTFPINELWVAGPLVPFFKALSAFRPGDEDLFGSVSPFLPNTPGWNAANNFTIANNPRHCLPNVAAILERYNSIINGANGLNQAITANPGLSDHQFNRLFDGPQRTSHMWNAAVANNANNNAQFTSPGLAFTYPGNLSVWKNALAAYDQYSFPTQMDIALTVPVNRWTAVMRFDQEPGEHIWFTEIAPMMARHAQFFRGSRSLEDCSPVGSASGSVKLRSTAGTTVYNNLAFTDAAAPNPAYFTHARSRRIVTDGAIAIRDLPDLHRYAGITTMYNMYWSDSSELTLRNGPFWDLGPNVESQFGIEVLPGVAIDIARDYHSDSRLDRS